MKCIVTGAGSFIGSAVIQNLVSGGHEVCALRHSFEEAPGELPDRADVWIHFAWAGVGSAGRSDRAIQDFNVSMALAAFDRALALHCRSFIFAGSQAEYGHAQDGGQKKEDGDALPVSEYGRAKREVLEQIYERMEKLQAVYAPTAASRKSKQEALSSLSLSPYINYIHLRMFSVYGPGDHGTSLISTLIRSLSAGDATALGPCTQLWNYLYIDDAASAICLLAACESAAGIYNIGGPDTRPLRDYVLEAADIIRGAEGEKLLRFGMRADNAEGPADLSPDISRITALGFRPGVSFPEGIRKILRAAYE